MVTSIASTNIKNLLIPSLNTPQITPENILASSNQLRSLGEFCAKVFITATSYYLPHDMSPRYQNNFEWIQENSSDICSFFEQVSQSDQKKIFNSSLDLDKLTQSSEPGQIPSQPPIDLEELYSNAPSSVIGRIKIMQLALDSGISIDSQDNTGATALILGCLGEHSEIPLFLIERGANLDIQDNKGNTALHFACRNKNMPVEVARRLIEKGANLDIQDGKGYTALHIACAFGNTEIAELLIERGANLDIQDDKGYTALHIARAFGNTEIAELLIES